MSTTIALPDNEREYFTEMYPLITAGMAEHKRLFRELQPYFMGINHEPAWQYMDEGMALLERVKPAIECGEMDIALVRDLHAFTSSPKPTAISGFTQLLQASYHYAHPHFTMQELDYEALIKKNFPKGRAHMNEICSGPSFLNSCLNSLASSIKKNNPALAEELDKNAQTQYRPPNR